MQVVSRVSESARSTCHCLLDGLRDTGYPRIPTHHRRTQWSVSKRRMNESNAQGVQCGRIVEASFSFGKYMLIHANDMVCVVKTSDDRSAIVLAQRLYR